MTTRSFQENSFITKTNREKHGYGIPSMEKISYSHVVQVKNDKR